MRDIKMGFKKRFIKIFGMGPKAVLTLQSQSERVIQKREKVQKDLKKYLA
jgi:hypothetical protein